MKMKSQVDRLRGELAVRKETKQVGPQWCQRYWIFVSEMERVESLDSSVKLVLEQAGYRGGGVGSPMPGDGLHLSLRAF